MWTLSDRASRATLDYGTVPAWHANFGYDVIAPGDVAGTVFANAGARPADRDSVDTLAVKNANAGLTGDTANMGPRITSQSQMGGWPVLAREQPRAPGSGQSAQRGAGRIVPHEHRGVARGVRP